MTNLVREYAHLIHDATLTYTLFIIRDIYPKFIPIRDAIVQPSRKKTIICGMDKFLNYSRSKNKKRHYGIAISLWDGTICIMFYDGLTFIFDLMMNAGKKYSKGTEWI